MGLKMDETWKDTTLLKKKKKILLFLWTLVLLDGKMRWKVVFREKMEKELILEAAMGWKSQDWAWSELS